MNRTCVFKEEDFIDYETLVKSVAKDPNHGVYVVNTAFEEIVNDEFDYINLNHPLSRYSEIGIRGVCIIEVLNDRQQSFIISIPAVDIPFNLIEFGGRVEDIIKSISFVNACRKGTISLLSKSAYESISQNPIVVSKRNFLRESMGSKVFGTGTNKTPMVNKLNKGLNSANRLSPMQQDKPTELTPVVVELCNTAPDISHSDQYKIYLQVEDKLTRDDFDHLVRYCPVAMIKESAILNLEVISQK